MGDYRLTSSSASYIDTGNGFCHATSNGSGTTVSVSCIGASTDPRHYFPQPGDYYDLNNSDCRGHGVRTADAINSGCFDVQIEGACGVRQITSMTTNSITFSGASCSWTTGAKVHVPWSGSAPDVGALEFESGAPQPPTLLTVELLP